MSFSDKLRKQMERKNVTAYRISEDTGISKVSIGDWLSDRYQPKLDKLKTLAEYFDVPLEYFLK